MLTLISGKPSPFARINRIALLEKRIPFQLKEEIVWHDTTETPTYNPLEKLPILLFPDGRDPVYDSATIQEYIIQKYADRPPTLLTGDLDQDLKARQIQALAEGVLDAYVLRYFELKRGADKMSRPWLERQDRKIDGGLKAMNQLAAEAKSRGSEYLVGDALTIADIAVVCAAGQMEFGQVRPGWQERLPELAAYWKNLDARASFAETRPRTFDLRHDVVV